MGSLWPSQNHVTKEPLSLALYEPLRKNDAKLTRVSYLDGLKLM
jgi:hypothetical protein